MTARVLLVLPVFPEVDRVLIGRERIAARVGELAIDIARELEGELGREGVEPQQAEGRVVLVPIMTGAMIFTADLVRRMPIKLSLGLLAVSSYPGTSVESRGAQLASDLPSDLTGKHVVILDDILDSGRTLSLVAGLVRERHPASVRTAVLLDKPSRRVATGADGAPFRADHVGFEIPDHFVVGYGLDFDGYYRNHPDIVVLRDGVLPDGA